MKPTAISILSGGLDSTTATKLALQDYQVVLAITFDYGQRAAQKEMAAAKHFCNKEGIKHQMIEIPWLASWTKTSLVNQQREIPEVEVKELDLNHDADLERAKNVWVPNRNGVFISIAAAAAESVEAEAVITGFNEEEAASFPDNSQSYLEAITNSLSFSTLNQVKVISPTIRLNKTEVFRTAVHLGIDPDKLWWCYQGGDKPCRKCESCTRNLRAAQAVL